MLENIIVNGAGLCCIGAAIAVGICGLAAGLSESGIGKTCIEKRILDKGFGKGLIMTVIPETIVIFGFVIAIMILNVSGLI